MKTKPVFWVILIALLVGIITTMIFRNGAPEVVSSGETDPPEAAEVLLARKLSGPGYFKATGKWIEVYEAQRQLPTVVTERKLTLEAVAKAEHFIEELTEEPPSRMVGGQRINLSRLNLSLDSLNGQ